MSKKKVDAKIRSKVRQQTVEEKKKDAKGEAFNALKAKREEKGRRGNFLIISLGVSCTAIYETTENQ